MYAGVIVDISHEKLDRTFAYSIPEELLDKVRPGVSVLIPFGKGNRTITGFVLTLSETVDFDPSRIKPIEGVVEDAVPIEGQLIALAAWMRENFGGTMNQALKTVLPIKQKMKPKEKKIVRLTLPKEEAFLTLGLFHQKNNRARARLLSALMTEDEIPYEIVLHKLNVSASVVKALEEMNMISVETVKVYRNPITLSGPKGYFVDLNEDQQKVVKGIMEDFKSGIHQPALIHGITGSGKTEVYMELIAQAKAMGKQSIVLIPEIALTYQTVMRFYKRFGDRVSILNSRLSAGERYDQFLRAKNGEIDVMIGPRSALFTPFTNLGFIIIDEEHETSYHSEQVPRYDAVQTAIQRARMCSATVVMGSATPSVDNYYRAKQGRYALYELTKRATGRDLATVHVVDLRKELEEGNRSALSRRLYTAMDRRLKANEQIMLFLNRRGVAGFLTCRTCGNVIKCPHCDVSLSKHNNGKMVCHYCGYETAMATSCPSCGSKSIGTFKAGTQKMEELVQKAFPKARILRMDFDTTREKDSHEKILSAFANQEADILIGTQMIVKGHDFPNVTLVGVLAADLSLYVSDFHASERTFQLLTQAAGRAGRSKSGSEVIIQTYNPEHFAIRAAADQDYARFYEEEILYREMLKYPPVFHLLTIQMASAREELSEEAAACMGQFVQSFVNAKGWGEKPDAKELPQVLVIGPATPSVSRINDNYRKILYLKSAKYGKLVQLKNYLENCIRNDSTFQKVSVTFDFNN